MTKHLLLAASLLLCATPAYAGKKAPHTAPKAETSASSQSQVRELLEILGVRKTTMQALDQLIGQISTNLPQVPQSFWDELRSRADENTFIDMAAEIYARHFTHDEIAGFIKFYRTPLGQAWIEKSPTVSMELMQAGQEWGAQQGMEILQELAQRGAESASETPEDPAQEP